MELTAPSLFALLFLIYLISRYFLASKSRCNIPGPNFAEVLLNFHLFGTVRFHKLLAEWAKRYGEIYTFTLFRKRFVVLNTPALIKTAFSVDERVQNAPANVFEVYSDGQFGASSTYKNWLDQRKLTVQSLKQYGFRGSGSFNDQLTQDLDEMILSILQNSNKPVEVESLQLPTLNLIWRVTTSTTLDKGRMPLLRRFQKNFAEYLYSNKQSILGPLFASLGLETNELKNLKKSSEEFREIQQSIIDDHVNKLEGQGQSEPEDYVDAYLLKMQDAKSKGSSFDGEVGRKNLHANLIDMNLAGSNTAAQSFQYVILNMIIHPELQDKLREQLDAVIGPNRSPVLDDRQSLPYFEAFILEVLRDFSTVPFTFHESVEDTKLEEYLIPKDSTILGNIWYTNHDDQIWDNPMSFTPERFIDASGEKILNSELVMSFGAGRKKCPGYQIAQDTLFLLTARLVQRFYVKQHPDHPITSLEPTLRFFLTTPNFKVLFEDRFNAV